MSAAGTRQPHAVVGNSGPISSLDTPDTVIRRCTDDVGLIDETAMTRAFDDRGWLSPGRRWDPRRCARSLGCVPMFGRFAIADTQRARTKAALLKLDRPATMAEIARTAGLPKRIVEPMLPRIKSLTRLSRGSAAKWITNETGGGDFATVAQAVRHCTDDAGVINVNALRDDPAIQQLRAPLDEILAACGWVRLHGQLCVDNTQRARIKAVLLHLDRAATLSEIAATAGLTLEGVRNLTPSMASLTRVGRRLAANEARGGRLGRIVAVVQHCRDEVGLIDEAALRDQVAREQLGCFDEVVDAVGLIPLHGCLAIGDTAAAAIKAALMDLGRPATLRELAEITGRPLPTVRVAAFSRCDAVQRVDDGPPHTPGLYDVVDPASARSATGRGGMDRSQRRASGRD